MPNNATLGWKLVGGASGFAAVKLTRKLLHSTWQLTMGGEPPKQPKKIDVPWGEALLWTIASTTGKAVARLVAARATAGMQHRAGSPG